MGYNKGDTYEEKIELILASRGCLFPGSKRAGASGGSDVTILHLNKPLGVEVKRKGADYGGKYLSYSHKKWSWDNPDKITDLYDGIGFIENIDPNFIPKDFNKNNLLTNEWLKWRKLNISKEDVKKDRAIYEDKIQCDSEMMFQYYKQKNCFYIQIEHFGFYHLYEDKYNLGTQQFDGETRLRWRYKTMHAHAYYYGTKKIKSRTLYNEMLKNENNIAELFKIIETPWDCKFQAVLELKRNPEISKLNLEENQNQKFPKFII